jgi:hypothetical protein
LSPQRRFALVVTLAAVLSAPGARARADDTGPEGAALALFAEGRRLMEAGDFADACPKFAESKRLAPGVGTALNLALCYEKLGKTASAWSQYLEAAASAREKGQTERQTAAAARAARLEPELLHATITVAPQIGVGSVEVKLDGRVLPKELWGAPTPVDPGPHEVEASAPGMQSWSSAMTVEAGLPSTLLVPALAVAPAGAPPEPVILPLGPMGTPPPRESELKTAGILVGAAGTVAMGLGIAFALAATSEKNGAECGPPGCTPGGESHLAQAGTDADVASVAIPLGIAAIAGGALLWLEAPRTAPTTTGRFGITPRVSQNAWTLTASEAW